MQQIVDISRIPELSKSVHKEMMARIMLMALPSSEVGNVSGKMDR